MRRFNLLKPAALNSATVGDADEETALDASEAPPSRRRLFLLSLLLIVVAALGVRNFIGTYVGKGSSPPLPAAERVVIPPTVQVAGPAPAPPTPAPVVIPERPAKAAPGSDVGAEPKLLSTSRPEQSPEHKTFPERAKQPREPVEPLIPKAPLRGRFAVQVGAMSHEANAHALSEKLEKLGYVVTIKKRRGSATQHVVLVGAPGDKSEADALTERLKAEGVPAIVGESDGSYRVEVGRSVEIDQAIDLAHELQKKGFTPKIATETATTTLYLVRVGQFTSRGEASRRARNSARRDFQLSS